MMEPLVLIPGMMCDARIYSHQINVLSRERPVMVVLPVQGDTIRAMVQSFRDLLPERFALAGVSMGGIVAMELLRVCPERITRICLMSTSPLAETPAEAAVREPMIVRASAGYLEEVLQETVVPEFLAPGPHRLELLQSIWQMGMELGPDLFVRQSRALQRRRDQHDTLCRSRVPALVLCGAHDIVTPVRRHELMAEMLPNAGLEVIENAGHLPVLEQPAAVTALLQDWLNKPLELVDPVS